MKPLLYLGPLVLLLVSCGISREDQDRVWAQFPPDRPYPNSHFQEEGEIRWHYRIWEPEKAPPRGLVVLFHGFGSHSGSWDDVAPELSRAGWRVLAADYPPFGFTQAGPGADMGLEASWKGVRSFAQAYGIADEGVKLPLVVGGHSLGGRLAVLWAREYPQELSGLVLVAPALGSGTGTNPWLGFPLWRWGVEGLVGATVLRKESLKDTLRSAYGREPTPAQVDRYLAPALLPGKAGQFVAFASRPGEPVLTPLRPEIPTLLIWGLEDAWVPLDTTWVPWSATGWRPEEFFLPEEGHVPQETRPVETSEALVRWLEGRGPVVY